MKEAPSHEEKPRPQIIVRDESPTRDLPESHGLSKQSGKKGKFWISIWKRDGGRGNNMPGKQPAVLLVEQAFVRDNLLASQTEVYAESLIRDLRAAAKEGQGIEVRRGCLSRIPLPPEAVPHPPSEEETT